MKNRLNKCARIFLILLFMTAGLLGAAAVGSVKFEQKGAVPLSEALLRHNIRLRKGAPYTREILDEDIKNLYQTGNFADVQAVTDYPDRQTVNVTFQLKLKERIASVELKGNKKFKNAELGKLITVSKGGLLNSAELRKSAAALRNIYIQARYDQSHPVSHEQVEKAREALKHLQDDK